MPQTMGQFQSEQKDPPRPGSALNLRQQARLLATQLQHRGWVAATAESCTGGGIAERLTSLPGSSNWFVGGIVSYSNDLKIKLLGVDSGSLQRWGAVSKQVVQEMVSGLLQRTGADIGVAVSGIAGPGGGEPDKPVGTVWCAWGVGDQRPLSKLYSFSGSRRSIREQTVREAIVGLLALSADEAPATI